MFKINTLRPITRGKFKLKAGDNTFESADAVPAEARAMLLRFAAVPPEQARGIVTFEPADPPPWPELAPQADPVAAAPELVEAPSVEGEQAAPDGEAAKRSRGRSS